MRSLVVLLVGSQLFGCLDTDNPAPRQEVRPTPVTRAPAPTPKPAPAPVAKVDLSLGDGFEMRRPIHDGRLTLIPIITTRPAPAQKFITLHDGMQRGLVSVREMGGRDTWQVDTVRVTNRSRETLVVLEGELIEDAMQDRVTAEAVTILAGSTQEIDVRCVEEDRDYGTTRFNPGHAIAEVALRRTVVHRSQDAVWSKVKQINGRDRIQTKTNTYRLAAHAQLAGDRGARKTRLLEQLALLEERPNMVGLAVAIDGKVVAIDRLATPELYRTLEGKLLASYLPDTSGDSPVEGKRIAPEDVRKLAETGGTTTIASHSVMKPL